MKTLKRWWKWRKAKRREYPLRYAGPSLRVRGVPIEYGTPLRPAHWRKAATGPVKAYECPEGIIRLLPIRNVEAR